MSHEPRVASLSGLRRAIYYAAISRGLSPDKAFRAAAARCCPAPDGQHTAGCSAALEEQP